MILRVLGCAIVCLFGYGLSGAETNVVVSQEQRLGPGDKVNYRVIEDQDEPRTLIISDAGYLDVPYFGPVPAMGKTTSELAIDVKRLLEKDLYYQATVSIGLEVVNKARVIGKVYVTGRVKNEGAFEIPPGDRMTVSRAIVMAGGFSDFSDKRNVRLMRKNPNGTTQTYVINMTEIWEKGRLEKDLVIRADDTIVVPARLVNY